MACLNWVALRLWSDIISISHFTYLWYDYTATKEHSNFFSQCNDKFKALPWTDLKKYIMCFVEYKKEPDTRVILFVDKNAFVKNLIFFRKSSTWEAKNFKTHCFTMPCFTSWTGWVNCLSDYTGSPCITLIALFVCICVWKTFRSTPSIHKSPYPLHIILVWFTHIK